MHDLSTALTPNLASILSVAQKAHDAFTKLDRKRKQKRQKTAQNDRNHVLRNPRRTRLDTGLSGINRYPEVHRLRPLL
ncbi:MULTISPECIES: CCE_0567 family metalloprotein [Bradyrhizobium]|uniref:Uncharacterized protein n=2 Tax=Bradyrhizobium TaxID=374 RepID=A0AAE5X8K7_9BRAD|nr:MULTISPECIES: CCE_0567 family metalloprotein [Bradyrhizobium]QOZ49604.1 hypothetical protein XH89_39765 [Bradyrhizobium sp. CCBAU 53340]QOZ56721.1 hypothetical protein XH90_35560 [Bradyrhizobium sp. CCBAU 53338]QOZ81363.1 hypothetical protein XH83_38700 [Bradyrhizobium sp. CCBAU 53351]MDN4985681.1 CCE_0567 family metalloprotein [Bradyrhizobium sp. WYCCWR 13022]MDT4740882.1 CCE_0567 family metalloprotein [Bradyrhizobium sp. WYCCWR 12699]